MSETTARSKPVRRRRESRARAWIAGAFAASLVAWSAPARAADDGAMGWVIGFGDMGGLVVTALPWLLLTDYKDPGPSTLGFELGAGRHLDGFAMGTDFGGMFRKHGAFGWTGRSRFEATGKDPLKGGSLAFRFDSFGTLQLAGDEDRALSLQGLAGFTVWPRFESSTSGDVTAYAGIGPLAGLRFHASSSYVSGEVDAVYSSLFGAPPTGKLHHFELGPAIVVTPVPRAEMSPSIELRTRFEVGLGGGDDRGYSTGLVAMIGVRLRLDRIRRVKR